MIDLPIGLQLYTVRDQLALDLDGTCKAVADIGYTHAEIGPFAGRTTDQVATAARNAGLEIIASHEGDLMNPDKADAAVQKCKDLGIAYVVQPYQMPEQRTLDGYRRAAEVLMRLTDNTTTCCYHNHHFEFEPLDGTTGWATLFEQTNLNAEMDTCWTEVGGGDGTAVRWLDALKNRVPLVHLKDCSDYGQKTLCEIGTGRVRITDIARAAVAAGAKYLVVEQDDNWIDGDPIKSARVSYENLKGLLQRTAP